MMTVGSVEKTFDSIAEQLAEIADLPVKQRNKEYRTLEKEISTEAGKFLLQAGLRALEVHDKVVTVEETEPLTQDVQLSEVLQNISEYVGRYLKLDVAVQLLVSYFVLLSWFVPRLSIVPYLYIKSQDLGYGKSSLGFVIRNLTYRSLFTESISEAALATLYEQHKGMTVILDEIDNWKRQDKSGIFALFKASIKSGAGRVLLRQEPHKKSLVPVQQDCFGVKVFIGIKSEASLDDPLKSRCLIVEMKEHRGVMPHVPHFETDKTAANLRRLCATVAVKYASESFDRHPELRMGLESLSARQFDTIEPLLILASLVDAERGVTQGGDLDLLKDYALGKFTHDVDDSYEKQLLAEVRVAMETFETEIHDLRADDRLYGYVEQGACRIVSRPPQWKTPQGEGDVITRFSLIRGLGGELGLHQLELYAQLLRQEDSILYRPPESLRLKTTAQGVLKPNAFAEIIRKHVRSKSSGTVRYFALDDLDQVLLKKIGEGIGCLASLKQRYHR